MLLTNDGELAHRLMHPSYEVPKTYLATVLGAVPRGLGRKLRDGIELDDGPGACRRLRGGGRRAGQDDGAGDAARGPQTDRAPDAGEAVGFPVKELVRTDIGEVSLGDQRPGSIRVLSQKEIGALYQAVGL